MEQGLLAGIGPPGQGTPSLRQVLGEVTAFSAKPPGAEVEAAHLSAMTELAQGMAAMAELTGRGPGSPPHPVILAGAQSQGVPSPRRLALGLATPALATPLCVIALAFAGVSLPHSLRAPFDAAGIGLPHQSGTGAARIAMERAVPYHQVPAHHSVHIRLHRASAHAHGQEHGSAGKGGKTDAHRGGAGPVLAAVGSSPPDQSTAAPASPPAPAASQPASAPPPAPAGPSPASGGGPPTPASGSSHPSLPPLPAVPSKIGSVDTPEIRPGKGCGDTNHVHLRSSECG